MHSAGDIIVAVCHNADGTCTRIESTRWACPGCLMREARPECWMQVDCECEVEPFVPVNRIAAHQRKYGFRNGRLNGDGKYQRGS